MGTAPDTVFPELPRQATDVPAGCDWAEYVGTGAPLNCLSYMPINNHRQTMARMMAISASTNATV